MAHVAVMAAGSWGTTFAKILADAGNTVRMWARREKVVEDINVHHMNPDYLPDVPLLSTITATANPLEALDGAEMVVLAVPSQTLRDNLADWAPHIGRDVTVISLMKGVELGTLKRMSEVIHEVGKVDFDRIAVVTGPNLAKEIASEQPTAAVVACIDAARAERVQDVITTKYFRPYTNTDVVGCELGGAIKNVIGLAFGMASGMGLGDNTKATLITRGLAEAIRLGSALGADPLTFSGLAGLGDLVATCVSPLSRNHTFGWRWDAAARWPRHRRSPARPPRASRAVAPFATWPARTTSRCRSPNRSRRSVTKDCPPGRRSPNSCHATPNPSS